MADTPSCSASLSNLICHEDSRLMSDDDDGEFINKNATLCHDSVFSESDDEYMEFLVSKEIGFKRKTQDSPFESWLLSARADAVLWIISSSARLGFGLKTAYVAVTFLDRFFVNRTINIEKAWAVQLLSVACLSLAAKMEENNAVFLPDFTLEEYEFKSESIQRMELLVLSTLEWRMISVTPFSYLPLLASKIHEKHGIKDLIPKAISFILSFIRVINSLDYRPSAVAAAAILAASDQRLTRKAAESKLCSISLLRALDNEHVYTCYTMMIQERNKDKFNPSKDLHSSGISVSKCESFNSSVDTINGVSLAASATKRRLQSG